MTERVTAAFHTPARALTIEINEFCYAASLERTQEDKISMAVT